MQIIQDSRSLGQRIRDERKQQGLTQEELSALAGVGIRFIRELEHGKETCRLGLALQLMQTLGLSVAVFARDERQS